MRGGKFLAEDRGAFVADQHVPMVDIAITEQVAAYRIADVLSDIDRVMWFEFRSQLRVMER